MIEPALLFGGRYEIGPVIGRGGMAEVRSGHDTRLDRPVAIKLLRQEMAHQPGVRTRFESEARLAARLIHPNVVAVFDSGEADGVPFIVMERLSGETLQDRMRRGPLPEGEVLAMAAEVLSALQAAHEAGILHRDIKPGNVLAAAGGRWKVGDFGIAKALELDQADLTATGLLVGTPAYLAPERFFGSPATVASDLYSVGVLLYEALTARRPFNADRPDAWASVVSGVSPPAVDLVRPGVDPSLGAAIDRCLARDPAERFASAAEMTAALTDRTPAGWSAMTGAVGTAGTGWSGEGPPAPTRIGPPEGQADTAVLGDDPQPSLPRPATEVLPVSDRVRRIGLTGRMFVAGAAAVVALIVVLAVAFSGGHGTSSRAPTATTPSTAVSPAATGGQSSPATVGQGGTAGLPPALGRAIDNLRHQVTRGR